VLEVQSKQVAAEALVDLQLQLLQQQEEPAVQEEQAAAAVVAAETDQQVA
jgi:hypothetical protein